MIISNSKKMDDLFITRASDILAATNSGLSGSKMANYFDSYARDFNKKIPHRSYPFINVPNKRTAFKENLRAFDAPEQFKIIKELCDSPECKDDEQVKKLKVELYERYGDLAEEKISQTELIQTTKHWLVEHPNALKQYESALAKFERGIFERNTLDDMRLSFELLVKDLMHNEKSLENQLAKICSMLERAGASVELRNMVQPVIKYYTDFQNHHVKHGDKINHNELEYVIELTSVIMKFLIKTNEGKTNG